jgi:hypothetical protein
MAPIVCKQCFENYRFHKPVAHTDCYHLLKHAGAKDVKAPPEGLGMKSKEIKKVTK